MSISLLPRIYFKGMMSFDPSLSNNFAKYYDSENVKLNLPPGYTIEQLKKELPAILSNPNERGSWNNFGTHHATFENVSVTGGSLKPGELLTVDPLIKKNIFLDGKLVDLDPTRDNGTQIFFDELRIGNPLAGLKAIKRTRIYPRFLTIFDRNLRGSIKQEEGAGPATYAGAVWEASFLKEDIELQNAGNSVLLKEIQALFEKNDISGLNMRFHTYRTLYFQNGKLNQFPDRPRNRAELNKLYNSGKTFSNPAYSVIVGTIVPWHSSESNGHPSGRLLFPGVKLVDGMWQQSGKLSTTIIEVNKTEKRITVDLGEATPEEGIDLKKADLGTLDFSVKTSIGLKTLGKLNKKGYDQSPYEATAGLWDIDLSKSDDGIWNDIENGVLTISGDGANLTSERPYVVEVVNRDVYIDEGAQDTIELQVKFKGANAPAGTKVHVGVYPIGDALLRVLDKPLVTDNNGRALFDIKAEVPGFVTYVFIAESPEALTPEFASNFNISQDFHVNVRTLPFDDVLEKNTTDSQLTWPWIYENILGSYDTLNPVMSRDGINFPLDNRARAEALVDRIKMVIDKNNFESASYMPVTRALSNGKRKLLLRWCELVSSGRTPTADIRTVAFDLGAPTKSVGHPSTEDKCPISHS